MTQVRWYRANSCHELLVGQLLGGNATAWQAPQVGVDETDKSIAAAAHQELYEETGLVVGWHIQVLCDDLGYDIG